MRRHVMKFVACDRIKNLKQESAIIEIQHFSETWVHQYWVGNTII